jgi:hypothetical protein
VIRVDQHRAVTGHVEGRRLGVAARQPQHLEATGHRPSEQARLWGSVTGAAVALDDEGWWSEANAINDESVPVGSMDASTDPTHSSNDVRIVKWDAYKRAAAT